MLDFERFNNLLTDKGIEHSTRDSQSEASYYLFEIVYRSYDVEHIDFDSFTLEDMFTFEDEFEYGIDMVDDYSEDMLVSDEHWFSVIENMEIIMMDFNRLPKIKPRSTLKFI